MPDYGAVVFGEEETMKDNLVEARISSTGKEAV